MDVVNKKECDRRKYFGVVQVFSRFMHSPAEMAEAVKFGRRAPRVHLFRPTHIHARVNFYQCPKS